MNKKSWKLAAAFSLMVFAIMTITMFIIGGIAMFLYQIGILQTQSREDIFIVFAIVSIIIGTTFSNLGGRKIISAIVKISEATKKVAKGDFDVKLNIHTRADEVNEMARNFTIMAQELSNMETFRNDFITNVSHEFKTPLSAIEGYATLLQNKALSGEKRDAYVEKILYNAKRLSSLTGNILQLSSLENQEIAPLRKPFSLDEQIRQMILLFEEEWSQKGLELDVDLEENEYIGNEELLAQVWQNLIGNALKFVSTGDTIRVILRKEERFMKVYISDTGAGMSEEVRNRVFEKFYQGDTMHSVQGNGLGLTLVKRIVDLHGGTVLVSSKEGKGSTFAVSLPL